MLGPAPPDEPRSVRNGDGSDEQLAQTEFAITPLGIEALAAWRRARAFEEPGDEELRDEYDGSSRRSA
jgi:hypothetical protein